MWHDGCYASWGELTRLFVCLLIDCSVNLHARNRDGLCMILTDGWAVGRGLLV